MKPIRLLLALTVAWTLWSCSSSHDGVTDMPPIDILDRFDAEGKAYMYLSVNADEAAATRAGDSDNGSFDDGTDNKALDAENAVYNGKLLLFSGKPADGEENAVLCSYYALKPDFKTDDATQIASKQAFVQQIGSDNIKKDDHLYCLVVLNYNSALPNSTLDSYIESKTTYQAFKSAEGFKASSIGSTTQHVGLLMSNAPVSKKPGGSQNPAGEGAGISTLVEISPDFIFSNSDDAKTNPIDIYVERAAAKITVGRNETTANFIRNNGTLPLSDDNIEVALDRYNTSFYLTRQFSDNGWLGYQHAVTKNADNTETTYKYRMVEQSPLATGIYRTYWGSDINYTDENPTELFSLKSLGSPGDEAFEAAFKTLTALKSTPYYCAENTMDYNRQKLQNSTALVIRIKLHAGNFYTINIEGSVIYPEEEPGHNVEDGTSADNSLAPRRAPDDNEIKLQLIDWLARQPKVKSWLETYADSDKSYLSVTITADTSTGNCTVTVSQTRYPQSSTEATAFDELYKEAGEYDGLNDYVNDKIKVKKYTGGYAYYRVPIKHFGNVQTPWAMASSTENGYTAQNHLGRYGVLRNNWYNITIESVNRIGEPVVPPADDTWDDSDDEALSLKVDIMPWLYQPQDMKF